MVLFRNTIGIDNVITDQNEIKHEIMNSNVLKKNISISVSDPLVRKIK